MSKFTLVVDSSQIACYLECPQKWIYYYVKRIEPVKFTPDENMNAGTYGHKLLDIYYRMKARGIGLNDTIAACNAYNPDTDICECGCTKDFHCPIPILQIEECKRCRKCSKFRAQPFYLNSLTRSAVRKRIVDYSAKYQFEDVMPLTENHVELGFSENVYEDAENLFVLEGRIDLIGKWQGLDCIVDHKFQSKTHWLYMKSVQLKNYCLVAKATMAVINYVRLQQKIQPDSLQRDIITFNSVELESWRKKLIQIFFRMKKTLQVAQSFQKDQVERNWNSCSGGRLTYDKEKPQFCWYTQLCEQIDPRVAETQEKMLYKINENPWRPW